MLLLFINIGKRLLCSKVSSSVLKYEIRTNLAIETVIYTYLFCTLWLNKVIEHYFSLSLKNKRRDSVYIGKYQHFPQYKWSFSAYMNLIFKFRYK